MLLLIICLNFHLFRFTVHRQLWQEKCTYFATKCQHLSKDSQSTRQPVICDFVPILSLKIPALLIYFWLLFMRCFTEWKRIKKTWQAAVSSSPSNIKAVCGGRSLFCRYVVMYNVHVRFVHPLTSTLHTLFRPHRSGWLTVTIGWTNCHCCGIHMGG